MALQPTISAPDYDKVVHVPGRDPLERLPERARQKLRELRRLAQQAADLLRPAADRALDAHHGLRKAQDNFDAIERAARGGQLMRTREEQVTADDGSRSRHVVREFDAKRYSQEKEVVARAKREFDDLREERDRRAETHGQIAGLVSELEAWLKSLPRTARLRDFAGPSPKLPKGATSYDEWVRLDAEIFHMKERIVEVRRTPIAASEAKALLESYVLDLAAVAMPDLSGVLQGGGVGAARWAKDNAEVFAIVPDDAKEVRGRAIVIDPLALLAWMSPEILIQRLHHEIDSLDDGTGIDAATRQATLAQLEADLLTAERAREHWLMEMEKGGQGGFRARGADPVAVLNVEVV